MLIFGPGVSSQQLTVPILAGAASPTTRTVFLTLSNPTGDLGLGLQATTLLAINERPGATSTSLAATSTPNLATFGQAVTFTAAVVPAAGGTVEPTGTVTFLAGMTTLGTAPLDATGHASFTTTTLPLGSTTLTAFDNGDTQFAGSGGAATVVVQQVPTTLILTASPPNGHHGPTDHPDGHRDRPGGPTGPRWHCPVRGQPGGSSTSSPSTPAVRDGSESPDLSCSVSSASQPLSVQILPMLTASTYTASPGQPISFTATVAVDGSTFPARGTVTFRVDGGALSLTSPIVADNNLRTATSTFASLPIGQHTITAAYANSTTTVAGLDTSVP